MKTFQFDDGTRWVATAERENTERHHGVWYLVFHPEGSTGDRLPVFEVRWQTSATAERTLVTMSDFELRRRLKSAIARHEAGLGPTAVEGEDRVGRTRTNVNAG
jgi:hypothetical protein